MRLHRHPRVEAQVRKHLPKNRQPYNASWSRKGDRRFKRKNYLEQKSWSRWKPVPRAQIQLYWHALPQENCLGSGKSGLRAQVFTRLLTISKVGLQQASL